MIIRNIVIDSFKDKCFIQKFDNHSPLGAPYIYKTSNLSTLERPIFGYSKKIKKTNYIKPSSLLIGEYVMRNYKSLVKKSTNDISPIYLSDNVYKKINDN